MNELQRVSSQILMVFQYEVKKLTKQQAEILNIHNKSVNFYLELGDEQKALWEAKQTLKYLYEITR